MSRNKKATFPRDRTRDKLESEFKKAKDLLEITGLVRVIWKPEETSSLSGEVRKDTVYIYERTEKKALEILRHEMIDYQITSFIIKPLLQMINMLIKLREQDIYREKERIVENLSRLLDQ